MLSKIPDFLAKLLMSATLVIASCSLNLAATPSFASSNQACDDVKLIFARGSGEPLNGPSFSAWRDEITATIGKAANNFSYSFYELGSRPQNGHQYPAVAVSDSFDGYVNLVGAYFSGGEAFRFGKSVEEGIKELRAYIETISTICPHTKFVLGGYSQGAMVLSASLPAFDAQKIIYVSTFGDPKLYLPEGKSTIFGAIPKTPDACRGINLSQYRISVPDCRAYEGVLGSYRPYQPEDYAGKLGTWCNEKDIMCSSGISISDHTSYVSSNLYRDAAAVIAKKLALAFPTQAVWPHIFRIAKHNVAFVVDTTYSMLDVIDQYRAEAKELASRVKADGGDVALLEYRDLYYDWPTRELCDFACSLDDFDKQLDGLTVGGGGATVPESALSALRYAMDNLNWQASTTKSIVLLTDADYHNPDHDGTTFSDVVQRSLEIDPVNIFVIAPGAQGVDFTYRKLAAATSGQVFTLGRVDLTEVSNAIFERPIARLALSTYSGQVGDEFYFDASASYASDGGSLTFDWDLDGDGQFELTNSGSTISHVYHQETNHFIQVRITDQNGKTSTMSAEVLVAEHPAPPATISNLTTTTQPNGAISISFQSDGAKVLLATDELVRGFVEVKDGAGQFLLGEVPEEMAITLTPYSSAGERGLSKTATIPATESTPLPDLAAPNPIIPTSFPSIIPRPATGVPKAPNTGLTSREYR